MSGTGVKPDNEVAMDHFAKAANGGFKEAQFMLGVLLVESNEAEAQRWLVRAQSSGCAGAGGALGIMYLKKGASYEAIGWEWVHKAAKEGDAMSQIMLSGHLRSSNKAEAYAWLKLALTEHPSNPALASAVFPMKALENEMDKGLLKQAEALADSYRAKYAKARYPFCSQSLPIFAGPLEYGR